MHLGKIKTFERHNFAYDMHMDNMNIPLHKIWNYYRQDIGYEY